MTKLRILALATGIGTGFLGAWAFFAPDSFYDFASYAPYSKHFIHDAGSFMLGLGAVLVLAAYSNSVLLVALGGNAVGAWFHFFSHVADRSLSANGSRDMVLIGIFAVVLSAGALAARKGNT